MTTKLVVTAARKQSTKSDSRRWAETAVVVMAKTMDRDGGCGDGGVAKMTTTTAAVATVTAGAIYNNQLKHQQMKQQRRLWLWLWLWLWL